VLKGPVADSGGMEERLRVWRRVGVSDALYDCCHDGRCVVKGVGSERCDKDRV
jgi:hypothetical protein